MVERRILKMQLSRVLSRASFYNILYECVHSSRRKKIVQILKFTYTESLNYTCISCLFPLVSQNNKGSSKDWEHGGFPKQEDKIRCPLLLYLSPFFGGAGQEQLLTSTRNFHFDIDKFLGERQDVNSIIWYKTLPKISDLIVPDKK